MEKMGFSSLKEGWERLRPLLSREDIRFIASKDTFRKRLRGFLTPAYWKREHLIKESSVVWGLVFKEWHGNPSETGNYYRDWVLFSPSTSVNEDPRLLFEAASALRNGKETPPKSKKEILLRNVLEKPLSDASYLKLPPEATGGELIYLSIVERPYDLNDGFNLGLHPLLMNPSISKEIIFLPNKYWREEEKKGETQNG